MGRHLLAHRSGIGDYLDEQDGHQIAGYVVTVPAHELASTEAYLAVLGGHPAKFRAGQRYCYCNSGYVVLALIAEGSAQVLPQVRPGSGVPARGHGRHRVLAV